MSRLEAKRQSRARRARRIRNVIRGTEERPRLSVNSTNRKISAQVIDDLAGKTIAGMKTDSSTPSVENAEKLGSAFAKELKKKKITKVVFDRGGRKFHGRLKAFADAARKEGLDF